MVKVVLKVVNVGRKKLSLLRDSVMKNKSFISLLFFYRTKEAATAGEDEKRQTLVRKL
jgi:hypothetical protein